MKVKVYATTFDPKYEDTLVWEGDMSCVPRKGDQVFVFDGWGGVTVERVYWELESQKVEIGFTDRSGEYSIEAKKRIK
jgi:hypothetical protein